jgi:hypothetical protein
MCNHLPLEAARQARVDALEDAMRAGDDLPRKVVSALTEKVRQLHDARGRRHRGTAAFVRRR